MSAPVVVVGAGLAGLSAACHLVGRGHEVLVVDAGADPGGRAGILAIDGYRFDTGPTVLTMPGLLAATFAAAGASIDDHLVLKALDPMYRACFADGSTLYVRAGRDAMRAEIAAVCGATEAAAFDRFCKWLTDLAAVEVPAFIDRNYDSPLDLLHPVSPLWRLARLGGFGRLDRAVGRFFTDDRLRRLFSFQALYAGVAPHRALAIYAVITYMDTIGGVYFPEGGMHAVPRALAAAAERAGVKIRYQAPVEQILRREGDGGGGAGAVRGVRLAGGETITADHVVCTVDLPVAYERLLPGLSAPRRVRRGVYSPSALVWHAGVGGALPEGVAHHNIHFGQAWRQAFVELIDQGRRMSDASMLVTVPTLDEPALAPPGRHILYALEPVPNLDGAVDWSAEGEAAREAVRRRVAALGYPTDVDVEEFVDPLDWAAAGMARGTPFALAHTFTQSGPFRPANVDRRVPGLVFAGSGTVPGVGVPMVLLSGRLAAERVGIAPVSADLDAAYERCREINKRHGTTYYWATQVLSPAKRRPVHAVYAFCRLADDIVDDLGPDAPVEARAGALAAYGDRFLTDLGHGSSSDPVLAAVVDTVLRWQIDPDCFRRFLRSMAMDLSVDRYATWPDLCDYMDGSAAVIGEMMLPVLEPTDRDRALGPARDLGNAFQLTNFLRDVDEDLDRGRVYLPQEDLARFGADPWLRRATPQWRAVMAFEIERARGLYESADRGIALLPPRSARCIATARRLYSGILERIEAADYDVFARRVRVPTAAKVWAAARAVVGRPVATRRGTTGTRNPNGAWPSA